jgi:transcription antitermination factor NusG
MINRFFALLLIILLIMPPAAFSAAQYYIVEKKGNKNGQENDGTGEESVKIIEGPFSSRREARAVMKEMNPEARVGVLGIVIFPPEPPEWIFIYI